MGFGCFAGIFFAVLGVIFLEFSGIFYLRSAPRPPAPPPAAVGPQNSGAGTPQENLEREPGGNFGNSGVAPEDVEQDPEFWEFPAPRDHP